MNLLQRLGLRPFGHRISFVETPRPVLHLMVQLNAVYHDLIDNAPSHTWQTHTTYLNNWLEYHGTLVDKSLRSQLRQLSIQLDHLQHSKKLRERMPEKNHAGLVSSLHYSRLHHQQAMEHTEILLRTIMKNRPEYPELPSPFDTKPQEFKQKLYAAYP